MNGSSGGIHSNGSLGISHSGKSDPPVKEEQNAAFRIRLLDDNFGQLLGLWYGWDCRSSVPFI